MSRPFQVVVQIDLDIATPRWTLSRSCFRTGIQVDRQVFWDMMGQISAPFGLRSSSPAALDVGDIAPELYWWPSKPTTFAMRPPLPSLQIRSFWTDWSGHEVRFPKPISCTTFHRPVDILALFVESGQTQWLTTPEQWGYYFSPTGGHRRGIGCDPTGCCCRRGLHAPGSPMTKWAKGSKDVWSFACGGTIQKLNETLKEADASRNSFHEFCWGWLHLW